MIERKKIAGQMTACRKIAGPHRDRPRLRRCKRGTISLEFALLAPTLFAIVLGILEIGMIVFANALLEGGLRDASRYGITGLEPSEGARETHIVNIINEHGSGLLDIDTGDVTMLVYPDFDSIGESEPFTDQNANDSYDDGEPYTDLNCNDQWDADLGLPGAGAGGEVVLYTVQEDWELLTSFMTEAIGMDGQITLTASVAVRNEPYSGGAAICDAG